MSLSIELFIDTFCTIQADHFSGGEKIPQREPSAIPAVAYLIFDFQRRDPLECRWQPF
ncbi:MAG: hypothetical protein U0744_05315 [Gemmataceae bacterium]